MTLAVPPPAPQDAFFHRSQSPPSRKKAVPLDDPIKVCAQAHVSHAHDDPVLCPMCNAYFYGHWRSKLLDKSQGNSAA